MADPGCSCPDEVYTQFWTPDGVVLVYNSGSGRDLLLSGMLRSQLSSRCNIASCWTACRALSYSIHTLVLLLLPACRDPGSSRGPSDLQSDALPAELSRLLKIISADPLIVKAHAGVAASRGLTRAAAVLTKCIPSSGPQMVLCSFTTRDRAATCCCQACCVHS